MSEIEDLENLNTEVSTNKQGVSAKCVRGALKAQRWRRYTNADPRAVFRGRKRRLVVTLAPISGGQSA